MKLDRMTWRILQVWRYGDTSDITKIMNAQGIRGQRQ